MASRGNKRWREPQRKSKKVVAPPVKDPLRQQFPLLSSSNYRVTSPSTAKYNCIAWAAGENGVWWWPDDINYWPDGVPREVTIASFKKAYEAVGFRECEHNDYERGYEKVAIYAVNGEPKHAARQLPTGKWASKLGQNVDIEHNEVGSIERSAYGYAVAYMKRETLPAKENSTSADSVVAVPQTKLELLCGQAGGVEARKRTRNDER